MFSNDDECSVSSEEYNLHSSGISSELNLSLQCGAKKMRLRLELRDEEDSDEEEDEWFWCSMDSLSGVQLRRFWVHEILRRRATDGEFVRVCLPYRKYPDRFFGYFRMTVQTFDYILQHIQHRITKHSIRPSITPAERLCVTLRYFATGMSFKALADSFFISPCTIGRIVPEVSKAIFETLVAKHMPVPSTEDFLEIAHDFEEQWNFPNCIGAIDGKHVRVRCPANSGTMFFNYKRFFSVVLQAVADSHCRFLFVDVGGYGKQSDGGVFEESLLNKFLKDSSNFPQDRIVEGIDQRVPYLFVVDDAYPLRWNMMKPYSRPHLTREEQIFNGRLSRARRCVECSFGILVNKWRLLLKDIETSIENACDTVKCLTVVHNVVIDKEGIDPRLMGKVKEKVDSILSTGKLRTGRKFNRSSADAMKLRDSLRDYFQSECGFVPWQDQYAT